MIQKSGSILRFVVLTEMPFGTACGTGLSAITEKLHLGTLNATVSCRMPLEDEDESLPSHMHGASYLYRSAVLVMAGNVCGRILCCVSSRRLCIQSISHSPRMHGSRFTLTVWKMFDGRTGILARYLLS
jgi:hypothetical protein